MVTGFRTGAAAACCVLRAACGVRPSAHTSRAESTCPLAGASGTPEECICGLLSRNGVGRAGGRQTLEMQWGLPARRGWWAVALDRGAGQQTMLTLAEYALCWVPLMLARFQERYVPLLHGRFDT